MIASARNVSKISQMASVDGIETIQLDVTSPDSIKASVAEVSKLTGGSLDAFVHNAGVMCSMPLVDVGLDQVRKTFETNAFAIISLSQAFLPLLLKSNKDSGGQAMIVNNSSIVAILPFLAPYNASKAAVSALTRLAP